MPNLFNLTFQAPRRTSLAILCEEVVQQPPFGETVRRRLFNLAHLHDPRVPYSLDVGVNSGFEAEPSSHPLELLAIDGPRPDARLCLQRLRALWLLTENRGGQITNDPVVPFRHQSALLQFLTEGGAPTRTLVADEVGLGKTVEAGLLIRRLLRDKPKTRILYLTLGGLVANVLEEFQRLDLPRWHFFANIDDRTWQRLNALPLAALTEEAQLVVASIHKLCDSDRWQEQKKFLAESRYDLIVIDECHTLRAYGSAADNTQVWFRSVRDLLDEHLVAGGRVLFLSATPHQGKRDVFLNLVALCLGEPLQGSEDDKARAARGRVVFRIKEHVRDWENKRIFPPRDVRPPRLAEPPANYQDVLNRIAEHFDWIAESSDAPRARTVGFVKSQALQYAASSLRAGFAYLLRRLIRYHPDQALSTQVKRWAERLLPYRNRIVTSQQLLDEWLREFRSTHPEREDPVLGELPEDIGPDADLAEGPRLLDLLARFDALFDDPEAGAKFAELFQIVGSMEEPIVVFSQAVDTVYELESRLAARGFEVHRLTGDMQMEDRGPTIRRFCQSQTPRRLLLSSAAGGIGINLQVARVAVHFDLPWNPMVLEQRVGRVHRIGSTRTIVVETILLKGSREAEVFTRITTRLQEIVRDLTADPLEREALFRRILASLDPDALREILSGAQDLDAVGAAVDAGRHAVNEADKYMQELSARTNELRGRASMDQLIQFLRTADSAFKRQGDRTYAVLSETEGGELHHTQKRADVFRFDGDDEDVIFDRTAASYLGLRRDGTGGLGHHRVDPLLRAAVELIGDSKARMSAWLAPAAGSPADIAAGDVLYFALEAMAGPEAFLNPKVRVWRYRSTDWAELTESATDDVLWRLDYTTSRKAGDVPQASVVDALFPKDPRILHFPLAAIGVRDLADRA